MPISIRLGDQLEHRLSAVSKRLRVNKSEVVKRSLEAYLDQLEPHKRLPARRGFVRGRRVHGRGCVSELQDAAQAETVCKTSSLIWFADRLNSTAVLTVDRRDFEVYRLSNGKAFQIIAE